MKSSFKKVDHNIVSSRIHFGHPDIDAILHNNLAKGHVMVLEEDHPTTNYLSLLRYFVSSSYRQKEPCLIYDAVPARWKQLVSPQTKQKQAHAHEDNNDIAWRYNKMKINLNSLVISDKAVFYDLSKQLENPDQALLFVRQYPNKSDMQALYRSVQQTFLQLNDCEKDTRSKKLMLSSLSSSIYKNKDFKHFLKALRCMTRSSHLLTLITIPPIIPEGVREQLLIHCDYYLQLNKLGKGYDDFNGGLRVLKEVEVGQMRTVYRGISLWGLKNRKKELRIQGLYEQALEEEEGPKVDF